MDSRRHFLRGLARAAAGGGRPAEPSESLPDLARDRAKPTATPAPEVGAAGRYAAALADPGRGTAARKALERSAVLVIGAGALGTPVLGYLAGAGVGRIGVLDDAEVGLADLHAETIHYTPDVGVPKVHSAAAKIGFLNPEIIIEPYQVRLEGVNAEGLLAGQDLVVDCSNDEATQVTVARTASRLERPVVSAAAWAHGGWIISVPAGGQACPVCAGGEREEAPRTPAGPSAGVIGALQAREALERLTADAAPYQGSILHVDLRTPELRRGVPARRPDCRACGDR